MHKRKKATEGEAILSAIYAIQLELRRAQAGFQDETDEDVYKRQGLANKFTNSWLVSF